MGTILSPLNNLEEQVLNKGSYSKNLPKEKRDPIAGRILGGEKIRNQWLAVSLTHPSLNDH
jgi:hypothetical protein